MRVVLVDEQSDELGRVEREVHAAQRAAEVEVAFLELPFGERREILLRPVGEDAEADVEEVDAAAESTRALFGDAVGALGDDADEAVPAGEEQEDLAGLAVLDLSQADTAVGDEGHRRGIIGVERAGAMRRDRPRSDTKAYEEEDHPRI